MYHVENERKVMSGAAQDRRQKIGVVAGVPDYVMPVARGPFFGFYMEVKAPGNYPGATQKMFMLRLEQQNVYTIVTRSVDECIAATERYLDLGPFDCSHDAGSLRAPSLTVEALPALWRERLSSRSG